MIPPDIEAIALLGWHVYPCSRTTKAGAFKGAHLQATHDLNQLARWARTYHRCNWRVIFGPSGIWGLDCDTPKLHKDDGVANLAELVKIHSPLPLRPTMRSGSGGIGIFFRHNGEQIIGAAGHPALGIDPRRGQQSQTIPPSIHPVTKQPYKWLIKPWEVSAPTAPLWLLKLVEPPPEPSYKYQPVSTTDRARSLLYKAATAILGAMEGSRNDTLNRRSFQIGRMVASGLLGEQEAVDALYSAARHAGLQHPEITATIKSGFYSGAGKGADWQTTR